MKFTVERNWIDVVGGIWWPYGLKCAMTYKLTPYDMENIGEPTKENIEEWLSTHTGDFSSLDGYHAVIGETEIPFETEELECTFQDCMFPEV